MHKDEENRLKDVKKLGIPDHKMIILIINMFQDVNIRLVVEDKTVKVEVVENITN